LVVTDQCEVAVIAHTSERTGVEHDSEMVAKDMQETIEMMMVVVDGATDPPQSEHTSWHHRSLSQQGSSRGA
jgi:hypothetical protein